MTINIVYYSHQADPSTEYSMRLMYTNPDVLDDWSVMEEIFTSGRSLFHNATLQYIERYRKLELDFGILPNPKFSEDSEDYYHYVHPLGTVYEIPLYNGAMPDSTGIISEALAFESYELLRPAFYEINVKSKYLRDDEWVRTAKEAGAKYMLLVAQPGTGFALWPTKAHEYSIKNSPWKSKSVITRWL